MIKLVKEFNLTKNSWKSIFFLWILVLGLVVGVQMVVKNNMDDRSKATDEVYEYAEDFEVMAECGLADGSVSIERPIKDLCKDGLTIWYDSVGDDGEYNWNCVDENNGIEVSCSSVLE